MLKSCSSLLSAAHAGTSSMVKYMSPVQLMRTPPNNLMASIPSRSKSNGFPSMTNTLTVTESTHFTLSQTANSTTSQCLSISCEHINFPLPPKTTNWSAHEHVKAASFHQCCTHIPSTHTSSWVMSYLDLWSCRQGWHWHLVPLICFPNNSRPSDLIGHTDNMTSVWIFSDCNTCSLLCFDSISHKVILSITLEVILCGMILHLCTSSSAKVSSFMITLAQLSIWSRAIVSTQENVQSSCLIWVGNQSWICTQEITPEYHQITVIACTTARYTCHLIFMQAPHSKPFVGFKGVHCKQLTESTLYLLHICLCFGT